MPGVVRPASTRDIPGIQRVAEAAWMEAHGPIIGRDTVRSFLDEYYDADAFDRYFATDGAVLAVAVDDGETVVGFVSALPDDEAISTYNLGRIYVSPDRWGDGIGQQLLRYAEETIQSRGGERITLGVMQENERAVGFYEAAGYDRVDEFYDERIDAAGYTFQKDL